MYVVENVKSIDTYILPLYNSENVMKRKLLNALLKYFEVVKTQYPDIKEPKKVFEPQVNMITKAFNISDVRHYEETGNLSIDVRYENVRVKCRTWYELGTYTCVITLAADNSFRILFYEDSQNIYGREVEVRASHPHMQDGKPCWGSFKTPIWNALYAFNYMGALAQIKSYLNAYNGRSTYINAPYYSKDISLPSREQRAAVFETPYVPSPALMRHRKAFKEDENVISFEPTCGNAGIVEMNQWLGFYYDRGYRNGILIKHVYDFFDGQVPIYSCFKIVKEYWNKNPNHSSVEAGFNYYLDNANRTYSIALEAWDNAKEAKDTDMIDKSSAILDIAKRHYVIIRDTKHAYIKSRNLKRGDYFAEKFGISRYHTSLRLNDDTKKKFYEIEDNLMFLVSNASYSSVFKPKETALFKHIDKIIDKKAYLAHFYGESDSINKIFDWSSVKAVSIEEVCDKLEGILSQLLDLQIIIRKYQLRRLERHYNQLFMEVRNETYNLKPGAKPHQLSFDKI